MATSKRTKEKSRGLGFSPAAFPLRERRFKPAPTGAGWATFLAGAGGALGLGIGVGARFLVDEPRSWAMVPLALGAGVLTGAIFFAEGALPVRVGDAGVALEKGNEVLRIAWCDLKKIEVVDRELVLTGDGIAYNISLAAHKKAIAWILSEATRRIPRVMNVKASIVDSLPKPSDDDGPLLQVEDIQVAGRPCGSSGKSIVYEKDALLCRNCGKVYHRDHLPKECVACSQELGAAGAVPVG